MSTNTNDHATVLAQLRDIQTPPPPGWWPPALGWWLLLVLVIAVGVGAAWFVKRQHALLARHTALATLTALERDYQQHADSAAFMAGASQLLRQCALTWFPERHPGGLTGEAWLRFLDDTGATDAFAATPIGMALITAPYSASTSTNVATIAQAVRAWLLRADRQRRKRLWREAPP